MEESEEEGPRWGIHAARVAPAPHVALRQTATRAFHMSATVTHGTHTLRSGGPKLAYALSHPPDPRRRAALIAHPYGRLGGSKDDHVVQALADVLVEEGYAVVRFDARGAGESEGSTSWTCAEVSLPGFPRPHLLTVRHTQRRRRSGRLPRARRRPRPASPLSSAVCSLARASARSCRRCSTCTLRTPALRLLLRLARRVFLPTARPTAVPPKRPAPHLVPPP